MNLFNIPSTALTEEWVREHLREIAEVSHLDPWHGGKACPWVALEYRPEAQGIFFHGLSSGEYLIYSESKDRYMHVAGEKSIWAFVPLSKADIDNKHAPTSIARVLLAKIKAEILQAATLELKPHLLPQIKAIIREAK